MPSALNDIKKRKKVSRQGAKAQRKEKWNHLSLRWGRRIFGIFTDSKWKVKRGKFRHRFTWSSEAATKYEAD